MTHLAARGMTGGARGDLRRGLMLMAGFAAGWFVVEAVLGGALHDAGNLLQIIWTRYAVHILLVAAIFAREPFWRTKRLGYQLARSALMLVMPMSFVAALALGAPAAAVWSGFWVAPLLIVAAGRVFLGERPGALAWGLAAVTAGAAMMLTGRMPPTGLLAGFLALVMAGSFAAYVAMTRSLQSETLAANLFYTAVVPFAALTPAMPFVAAPPGLRDGLVMVGIGSVGLFTLYLLDRAAAAAPVSLTAPALAVLALLSLGAGLALGQGAPTTPALLGAGVVLVVVALLWRGAGVALRYGAGR